MGRPRLFKHVGPGLYDSEYDQDGIKVGWRQVTIVSKSKLVGNAVNGYEIYAIVNGVEQKKKTCTCKNTARELARAWLKELRGENV